MTAGPDLDRRGTDSLYGDDCEALPRNVQRREHSCMRIEACANECFAILWNNQYAHP